MCSIRLTDIDRWKPLYKLLYFPLKNQTYLQLEELWFPFLEQSSSSQVVGLFPKLGTWLVKILLSRQPKSLPLNETNDLSSARSVRPTLHYLSGRYF